MHRLLPLLLLWWLCLFLLGGASAQGRPRNAIRTAARGSFRTANSPQTHPRLLKKDKDKEDDDEEEEEEEKEDDGDEVEEDKPVRMTNEPTVSPPSVGPPAMTPGDQTEDADEFQKGNNNQGNTQQDIENACRAASRGNPIETSNTFVVTYQYQLLTTLDALYSGFAIDYAVQEYLTDKYIMAHCDTFLPSENGGGGGARNLQGSFAAGDVRGVQRGDTQTLDEKCKPTGDGEANSTLSCFVLQGENKLFLSDIFVQNDFFADAVLNDVRSAFSAGEILTRAQRSEPEIVQVDFVTGTAGTSSIQGDAGTRSSGSSSGGDDGMKPAGKVFLSFFILMIFGVIGYVGFKYGKPKYQTWNENRARRQRDRIALDDSFSNLRKQRERSDSLNDIVIAETMESCSTDGGSGGAGTEMILADLQDVSAESPVEFHAPSSKTQQQQPQKYTPSTLPDIEERSRPYSDSIADWSYSFNDVSFGDIQVVVEEEEEADSRYTSSAQRNVSRKITTPDTVSL